MFQVLSLTLLISRLLFVIQYSVVLSWTMKRTHYALYLPLGLNILVYLVTSAIFAITATALSGSPGKIVYSIGYIVLLLEAFSTVAISCYWQQLSFKKSHLNERMGLLTLIVIGEGAIGVTKTISKLLGKGQDLQLSGTIFCIILILFFIWMLYFDNRAPYDFGTIRQQIWSTLHFPLHLAIVGAVEGSQQMALATYVLVQSDAVDRTIFQYCMDLHVEGADLVKVLDTIIKPFSLDKKPESSIYVTAITNQLQGIGNTTGLCSPNISGFMDIYKAKSYPQPLRELHDTALSALYASVSVASPKNMNAIEIAYQAWQVVYNYYWASMILTFFCLAIFIVFRRDHSSDLPHFISIASRLAINAVPLSFIIMAYKDHAWMYSFIGSPWVIPAVVLIHVFVLSCDMICTILANWSGNRPILVLQEKGGGHN